jgi:hypothetical protein
LTAVDPSVFAATIGHIAPGMDSFKMDANGDGKIEFIEFYSFYGYVYMQRKPGQCGISFAKYANSPYTTHTDTELNQCISKSETECIGDCQWWSVDTNKPNTCLAVTDQATCETTEYDGAPCTFTHNKCMTMGSMKAHAFKSFKETAGGAETFDAASPMML